MKIGTLTIDDVVDMMRETCVEDKIELLAGVVEQLWRDFDPMGNVDAWGEINAARQHINYIKEFMEEN